MTAEAVVLNKSAVAMAADSAVSITRGRQGVKVFNTANKLFELVRGCPVGIMFYANAEFNGVPWETVVKTYRASRSTFCGETTKQYVDDFIGFLNAPDSMLFSDESETLSFELLGYELILDIAEPIINCLDGCVTSTGRLVRRRLIDLAESAISAIERRVAEASTGGWGGLTLRDMRDRYGDSAVSLVADVFENLPLSQAQLRRVSSLLLLAGTKDMPSRSGSGVVIAGFGSREPFPSVYPMSIRGRLAGVVRVSHEEPTVIDQSNPGQFQTFAQDAPALQFVTGIHGRTRREIVGYWGESTRRASQEIRTVVKDRHPRLSDSTLDSIAEAHVEYMGGALERFLEHMNDHQQSTFIDPFVSSIGLLPKDELAHLAESLVNLTSMSQRFSAFEDETVGGEIDVALISRGDGLVWIKRKHYFTLSLNPNWPLTHAGRWPGSVASEV